MPDMVRHHAWHLEEGYVDADHFDRRLGATNLSETRPNRQDAGLLVTKSLLTRRFAHQSRRAGHAL